MKQTLLFVLIICSIPLKGQAIYDTLQVKACVETINEKISDLIKLGEAEKTIPLSLDSLCACVEGRSLEKLQFESIEGTFIQLKNINIPIILKMTSPWCRPCVAEIPAINRIAEEYAGRVKIITLFNGDKESLNKKASAYSSKIELIPSKNPNNIKYLKEAGFKHFLAYPTNYFLNESKEIVYAARGAIAQKEATADQPAISKTMADQINYDRLKHYVEQLLIQ